MMWWSSPMGRSGSRPTVRYSGAYEGHRAAPEVGQHVYRLDAETGEASVVADDVLGPNGLCFSPDETTLYVVESRGVPHRKIVAFDVITDGRELRNKRVLIDAGPGTPDGMRCDIDGNLWCGWGMGTEALDGVWVFARTVRTSGASHCPNAAPTSVSVV